ncbi:MAG: hypothetical protein ABR961_07815 [Thermoanaerobaculaceae bacterium]|jgi:hypothetical protein
MQSTTAPSNRAAGSYVCCDGKYCSLLSHLKERRVTGSQRRDGSTPAPVGSRQVRGADTVVLAATPTAVVVAKVARFARAYLRDERR